MLLIRCRVSYVYFALFLHNDVYSFVVFVFSDSVLLELVVNATLSLTLAVIDAVNLVNLLDRQRAVVMLFSFA